MKTTPPPTHTHIHPFTVSLLRTSSATLNKGFWTLVLGGVVDLNPNGGEEAGKGGTLGPWSAAKPVDEDGQCVVDCGVR